MIDKLDHSGLPVTSSVVVQVNSMPLQMWQPYKLQMKLCQLCTYIPKKTPELILLDFLAADTALNLHQVGIVVAEIILKFLKGLLFKNVPSPDFILRNIVDINITQVIMVAPYEVLCWKKCFNLTITKNILIFF